jgi:hypothetical protein
MPGTSPPDPGTGPTGSAPRGRQKNPALIVAIVVVALALGGIVYALTSGGDDDKAGQASTATTQPTGDESVTVSVPRGLAAMSPPDTPPKVDPTDPDSDLDDPALDDLASKCYEGGSGSGSGRLPAGGDEGKDSGT